MLNDKTTQLFHASIYQDAEGALHVHQMGELWGTLMDVSIYRPPLDEQQLRRLEHHLADALGTALLTAQERHPF